MAEIISNKRLIKLHQLYSFIINKKLFLRQMDNKITNIPYMNKNGTCNFSLADADILLNYQVAKLDSQQI